MKIYKGLYFLGKTRYSIDVPVNTELKGCLCRYVYSVHSHEIDMGASLSFLTLCEARLFLREFNAIQIKIKLQRRT